MSIIPVSPPPPAPASIGTFLLNPPPPPSIPPLPQDDGCGQKHVLQFPHYHCFSLLSFWLELRRKYFFFFILAETAVVANNCSVWKITFSYFSKFVYYFFQCRKNSSHYTVTRIDVIFRYPDRVPLTHFVHGAKKVFSM
jgi:hypothetical protein